MKKIKSFITIFFIFLILAIYLTNIVYSTSAEYIIVTTENLKTAYSKFLSKSADSDFYADVTDTAVNIHSDGVTKPLNYTLGKGTTFTINSVITPNMTYEEYSDEISKTILPLYGFLGVAIVQETELSDAFTYISADLLASDICKVPNFSSSILSFSSNSYVENSSGKTETLAELENFSAFEETKLYDTPLTLNDTDEFGLYSWEVKKISSSDEKIVISSTLTANESNNYIKLDGYNEIYADALNITNNSISMNRTDIIAITQNRVSNTENNINNNKSNNTQKNTVTNNITSLPKAGINISVITMIKIILAIAIAAIIIFTFYNISEKRDN